MSRINQQLSPKCNHDLRKQIRRDIVVNTLKITLVFIFGFVVILYLAGLPESGSYFTDQVRSNTIRISIDEK
ncbi:MAG: hypothetical protein AB1767_07145 [Bacillota bacterium]